MEKILKNPKILIGAFFTIVLAGGALYVHAEQLSAKRIIAECSAAKNKPLCYTDHLDEVLKRRGLSPALSLLAAAYAADPEGGGFCHGNTHDLGKAAYEEFHRGGEVKLGANTYYCGYGFYHGFLEALVVETGSLDEAREFCTYAGKSVPKPEGYAEGACYHGIGHGVTDGSDPGLWGSAE